MNEPLEALKGQLKDHLAEVMARYRQCLIQSLLMVIEDEDRWTNAPINRMTDEFMEAIKGDLRELSHVDQMQLIAMLALIGAKPPATPASTKQALDEIRQL